MQGEADQGELIHKLEEDKARLERQLLDAKAKQERLEKREIERRLSESAKHNEELTGLRRTNQQLKAQLDAINATCRDVSPLSLALIREHTPGNAPASKIQSGKI